MDLDGVPVGSVKPCNKDEFLADAKTIKCIGNERFDIDPNVGCAFRSLLRSLAAFFDLGTHETDGPQREIRFVPHAEDCSLLECYSDLMQVRVLFFGSLRDLLGRSSEMLTLDEGAPLSHLLDHYVREYPELNGFVPSLALSVNQEYATHDLRLHEHDEVALLPPVSGGLDPTLSGQYCTIVRNKIDVAGLVEKLKKAEDGAVVAFEGTVRNHTRGRRTLYLDYEAYEGMAVKQMDELVSGAREKFAIDKAHIVHRLGRMEIGETSVLIVVSSAHRAPAFDACRYLIDTLKKTVPIWKKEYFADGAVWADGEPFPPEVRNAALTNPTQATSK